MIVRFAPPTDLHRQLKARVNAYLDMQDDAAIRRLMLTKTTLIFLWTLTSYVGLVFWASTWFEALLLSTSLGLAFGGVGFAVQHDANHGAYPVSRPVRRALGFCLDIMGGSSYIWKFQHNINHHSFTNIAGADNDINIGLLARLSPVQPHRGYHALQFLYIWPLYSLLAVNWLLWADWRDFFRGSIGYNQFPRPKGAAMLLFWLGKGIWLAVGVGIPALVHPIGYVVLFWLWTYLALGFTMAIVFQLAHIVEEAELPTVSTDDPRVDKEFALHQLSTTANFATNNRLLSWYLGGLNFQVEHHLFPRVCHLHYPGIAPIVAQTCREFDVPYCNLPTFRAALFSHARCLARMGKKPFPTASEQRAARDEPTRSQRGRATVPPR